MTAPTVLFSSESAAAGAVCGHARAAVRYCSCVGSAAPQSMVSRFFCTARGRDMGMIVKGRNCFVAKVGDQSNRNWTAVAVARIVSLNCRCVRLERPRTVLEAH